MLTESDRKAIRRHLRKSRAAANSFRASTIPPIGHVFDDGEVFTGIPGGKMAPGSIVASVLADNSVTSEKIAGLDGGKLHKNSVPTDAIHNLHGSKIVGEESVPWKNIRVEGVVFTERLDATVRDLKRFMAKNYQRKS